MAVALFTLQPTQLLPKNVEGHFRPAGVDVVMSTDIFILVLQTARVSYLIRSIAVHSYSSLNFFGRMKRFFLPRTSGNLSTSLEALAPNAATAGLSTKVRKKSSGSLLGLLRYTSHVKKRRDAAATHIQRAWRKKKGFSTDMLSLSSSNRSTLWSVGKISLKRAMRSHEKKKKHRFESQVGFAMGELTGQRVASGIIIPFLFTVLLTYREPDITNAATMGMLHTQTQDDFFGDHAVAAARSSSVPTLSRYTYINGTVANYLLPDGESLKNLREREKMSMTVKDHLNRTTSGIFNERHGRRDNALVKLVVTFLILLIWPCGMEAFARPVMILVVNPIERIIRLLEMIMLDPLGYQTSRQYKTFVEEEDKFLRNTTWKTDVLEGMET